MTSLDRRNDVSQEKAAVGGGILWATQIHAHGYFWADLAGPLFVTGGCTLAFIPVSIRALAGVAGHDAGVASGLLNTSQQIGGAIGVAIASTIAATHTQALLRQGHATAVALTGGFQWALWVSGLAALIAVPVTFLLIRRTELARAAATARQREVL
jgi:MFS family permease